MTCPEACGAGGCAGCPLCATQEDRHLASEAARGSPSELRDCSVLAEVLSDQRAAVFCPGAYTGAIPDMDIARSPTIKFARVLRSPLSRLQDDLNQAGPAVCHCAGELCRKFLNRGCAARLDAHTRSKLDPIKFGIVDRALKRPSVRDLPLRRARARC